MSADLIHMPILLEIPWKDFIPLLLMQRFAIHLEPAYKIHVEIFQITLKHNILFHTNCPVFEIDGHSINADHGSFRRIKVRGAVLEPFFKMFQTPRIAETGRVGGNAKSSTALFITLNALDFGIAGNIAGINAGLVR